MVIFSVIYVKIYTAFGPFAVLALVFPLPAGWELCRSGFPSSAQLKAADPATDILTPVLLGGMEGDGFQPANTVGGGGTVWEGRLFCFAPVLYICGALHATSAVPGVQINLVS